MGRYDAYPRAPGGGVVALRMTFEARNDAVALAQAVQWADGRELEVWHEGKRVGSIVEHRMLEDCGGGARLPR